MSIKSTNVKNYIKDVGTKNQLFAFVGSDTSNTTSESSQSNIDLWKQSDFSVRIGQNSLSAIIENVPWTKSRYYTPWSSVTSNADNFYAYNNQNGYVYLCISDNSKNRIDLLGRNVSTIRPSHISGIQSYDDGYSWRPLYKITPSIERFVSTNWIPVVSFDLFDDDSQQTQSTQTDVFCSSAPSNLGKCGIYAKIPLSTDTSEETVEYQKGDLFTTANNIACSDCFYLMKNNEKFTSVFYENSETVESSIVIKDQYDRIGDLIQSNQLTASSPYYHLYQTNTNDNLEEGSVVSVRINLEDFTAKQLTVTSANPELTVLSNSGTGARIRLTTSIISDDYVIDGIELVSAGSGYKDIIVQVPEGILSPALDESVLASAIQVNIDTIDGLGFDPIDVLGAKHLMIDVRLDKQSIENSGILIPSNVNFFGLIENPSGISTTDTTTITGSNLNKKIDYIFRTTAKVTLSNPRGDGLPEEPGELYEMTYTKNTVEKTNLNTKIGGINATSPTVADVELKNIIYSDIDFLDGGAIDTTSKGSDITAIVAKPVFQQYSGKVLSTTKLENNLPISDIDSVIIRINMIKGM